MSVTGLIGGALALAGAYSVYRVRRDRAAAAEELARMSVVEGVIRRHRHSTAAGNDGLGDSDHFVPVVEYEVGSRRYELELPQRAGFRPGPLGGTVMLAFDPAAPGSARTVAPRDPYAMHSSVAVLVLGLALAAAAILR